MKVQDAISQVKEVTVIEVITTIGDGKKSPIMQVKQYWTKDGKLIGIIAV